MIGQDNSVLWIIAGAFGAICVFILGLLARTTLKRHATSRPESGGAASQSWHDLIWTIGPVLAFALVMAPVMRLLSLRNTMPAADLTITMTGHMWFWNFKYSNHANFSFDAPMLSNSAGETISNLAASATFDHIMVPVARTVRIVAVATNVIYSWAIPSLGAKIEAVPGWNSQTWFKPAKEGRYFGKCSELCGLPHKFKPIEIEVVSQARFDRWVAESKGKLTPAGAPHPRGEEARSEAWNAR